MTVASNGRPRAVRDLSDEGFRELVYRVLCVFWFTIPPQGVVRLGGEATISKGMGGLLALVAFVSLAKSGRRARANDYIVLLLAFASWVTLSMAWTYTPQASELKIITMAQLVLMALLTWEFARTRRQVRGLMSAWIAGSLVNALIIVYAFATGASATRYTAPGTHAGDQAYALLLAIPMAWYLAMVVHRRGLALAYRLFVPLALLAVLLTASRAAALSAVVALVIIPLTMGVLPPRVRAAVGAAAVLAVAAGAVLLTAASGPIARLATTTSEISSGTLDQRTTLWSIALGLIAKHPILGLGTGGSKSAVGAQFTQDRVVHDTYLSIGVDLGVIGLALFLLVILAAVYRALTRLPWLETRLAWVLGLVFLVSLVPRADDYDKSTYVMLTLLALLGSVFSVAEPDRSTQPASGEVALQ